MKKAIFIIVSAAFFIACNSGPERWTKTSTEVDVAKALVKDYQAGNWTSWSSHYADTAKIFHNSVDSITPQQLQDAFKADNVNYSKYSFREKDNYFEMITDDKNEKWVYFWGTWEGTMKSNNQTYIVPVHLAVKFENNKIVREYGYYNRSQVDAAIKEGQAAAAAAPAK
jgi:hypothetical protein